MVRSVLGAGEYSVHAQGHSLSFACFRAGVGKEVLQPGAQGFWLI